MSAPWAVVREEEVPQNEEVTMSYLPPRPKDNIPTLSGLNSAADNSQMGICKDMNDIGSKPQMSFAELIKSNPIDEKKRSVFTEPKNQDSVPFKILKGIDGALHDKSETSRMVFEEVKEESKEENMDVAEPIEEPKATENSSSKDRLTAAENMTEQKGWLGFDEDDKKENNFTKCPIEELTEDRIKWREKQIKFGKNTDGYKNYVLQVPRSRRSAHHTHVTTPDVHMKTSKREFNYHKDRWRRMLHRWDPTSDSDITPVWVSKCEDFVQKSKEKHGKTEEKDSTKLKRSPSKKVMPSPTKRSIRTRASHRREASINEFPLKVARSPSKSQTQKKWSSPSKTPIKTTEENESGEEFPQLNASHSTSATPRSLAGTPWAKREPTSVPASASVSAELFADEKPSSPSKSSTIGGCVDFDNDFPSL